MTSNILAYKPISSLAYNPNITLSITTLNCGATLYCFGIENGEILNAEFEKLSAVDCDEVFQQSITHGIAPLLYHCFTTDNASVIIPPRLMQKLQESYFYTMRKNMRLYHDLSKILKMLQDNHVRVIVLKGAALAEIIYQNIALRPMTDVDLLIKNKDIWSIAGVLSQLGYTSNDIEYFLLSIRHLQWIRYISFKNNDTSIDIHTKIYEFPEINPWMNAVSTTIASTDTLVLGSEDFLLHLCLHVYRHLRKGMYTRLIWWYDIVKILKHYQTTHITRL